MRAAAAAAVAAVLLSACAPTGGDGSGDRTPSSGGYVAEVDTPQLRALKATTGIPDCEPGSASAVDGGLPDLTLPCLGGGPGVNLGSLRGPLVVNLWAQWCGPCRHELPIYADFHREHGDRVAVLGIDFNDQHPLGALEMAKQAGLAYPQLADPGASLIGPVVSPASGLPVHLFIDADGRLVHRVATEIKSLEQLEDLVAEHLGVRL